MESQNRLRSRNQSHKTETQQQSSGIMNKEEGLDLISAEEAEVRISAKRQARFEARNMRMKEIEKKRKEEEKDPTSGNTSGPDSTLIKEEKRNQQRNYSSPRKSSSDCSSEGESENYNSNVRDLKIELKELEEKFRKTMVTNAGLDNEKSSLVYQIDLLKDRLEERDELHSLVKKELREKHRQVELLKKSHDDAERSVRLLQAQLDEQCLLLTERGFVKVGSTELIDTNDDDTIFPPKEEQEKRTRGIVSNETAHILSACGSGPLDLQIKRLAEERNDLQDTVGRLKLDLEEQKTNNLKLERLTSEEDAEKEAKRLIDEYKFKFQKCEQDSATLATNVARLETQVVRFKTAAETAERSEHELKAERRKLQRELRESSTRIDELETSNKHLEARLAKLKTAKSNLLKEL
ncbi:leucine-rich repeat flightless-interacting protein 2-like [Lepeophtheirus salmonis]|nr:leucine-rich repeat flightless-interacting protein 2-like [Lepeophtheirus salmonis]ACO11882.1 Leucine-rich repeat flightless-interacting protein 2 [Lepeophtheirus salmonis]